jgi:hypothetical protein
MLHAIPPSVLGKSATAAAPPVIESHSFVAKADAVSTITGTLPTGTQEGDLLVAFLGGEQVTATLNPPTGWTAATVHLPEGGIKGRAFLATYASGLTLTFNLDDATTRDEGLLILRISGAADDASQPDVAGSIGWHSGGSSIELPSITVSDNTLVLALTLFDGGDGTRSVDETGWTDYTQEQLSTSTTTISLFVGYKAFETGASTGDVTVTTSVVDGHVGVLLSIASE